MVIFLAHEVVPAFGLMVLPLNGFQFQFLDSLNQISFGMIFVKNCYFCICIKSGRKINGQLVDSSSLNSEKNKKQD